jgi:hypothetical protein
VNWLPGLFFRETVRRAASASAGVGIAARRMDNGLRQEVGRDGDAVRFTQGFGLM